MYDAFSQDYDRFVNWQGRLDYEMPFIETQLGKLGSAPPSQTRVLDAACGTGWHTIGLAQRGYVVTGADLSLPMVERARLNAAREKVSATFLQAGFGQLADRLREAHPDGEQPQFDALLCMGNSLPHILDPGALQASLADFAACLRPGGLLLIQNRNFDAVVQNQDRWMGPQGHDEADGEWLFVRFYDFRPDGLIDFNILTLARPDPSSSWQQHIHSTHLYPLRRQELDTALAAAGFSDAEVYGDMVGAPFNPDRSGNLVAVCCKR